jgi:hypothetical protein
VDAALITGATAVASGLLGYLGSLLQHRAEGDRIGIERDRLRLEQTRLERETAQVNDQRLAQQREDRRALYLAFLEVGERAWSLCTGYDEVPKSELDGWWRTYQTVRRQLLIGGASEVVAVAYEMNASLVAVFNSMAIALAKDDAEARFGARGSVWDEHGTAIDDQIQKMQRTMRADLDIAG